MDRLPMVQGTFRPTQSSLARLLAEVRRCKICSACLPLAPRPVLRAHVEAPMLIVGQAPGLQVHETGIPWNDASGDRLRHWLAIDRSSFYNERLFAILPMGYCYPGRGRSGDLPPRPECAEKWLPRLLEHLPNRRLTLLVGQYAQRHYLGRRRKASLTATVQAWQEYLPEYFPLPHPSGRNNGWLQRNRWFEVELLPSLRQICARYLQKQSC